MTHTKKPGTSAEAQGSGGGISRRRVLGSAVSATTIALLPVTTPAIRAAEAPLVAEVLSPAARAVLVALCDRLVPADENGPGAVEAGAANYIERSLADWNSAELPGLQVGLEGLDALAREQEGSGFAELPAERRDALLQAMEAGEAFAGSQAVFARLHRLTLEGMFSDPYYGGNRNFIGWDLIGYPGAVMASTPDMQALGGRLPPLHTSAYGADYDGD